MCLCLAVHGVLVGCMFVSSVVLRNSLGYFVVLLVICCVQVVFCGC